MSMSVAALLHHFEYNAWANARLLEAVSRLSTEQLTHDFGTADKSILGTLGHICAAETVWLQRVKEEKTVWDASSSLEQLQVRWPALGEAWQRWVAALAPEGPEHVLAYHDMKGNAHSNALWHILLHVVNHSTHHRGQVSGFLRTLGVVPPALDLILFVRLRQSGKS